MKFKKTRIIGLKRTNHMLQRMNDQGGFKRIGWNCTSQVLPCRISGFMRITVPSVPFQPSSVCYAGLMPREPAVICTHGGESHMLRTVKQQGRKSLGFNSIDELSSELYFFTPSIRKLTPYLLLLLFISYS